MSSGLVAALKGLGIGVNPAWLAKTAATATGNGGIDHQKRVFDSYLQSDVSESGAAILPPTATIQQMNNQVLSGPFVLQLESIINIAEPQHKVVREGKQPAVTQNRMYKVCLTDGTTRVYGIEYRTIPQLSLTTAPGSKIVIRNVSVRRGLLMLQPEQVEVLGGAPLPRAAEPASKPVIGAATDLKRTTLQSVRPAPNILPATSHLPPPAVSPLSSASSSSSLAAATRALATDNRSGSAQILDHKHQATPKGPPPLSVSASSSSATAFPAAPVSTVPPPDRIAAAAAAPDSISPANRGAPIPSFVWSASQSSASTAALIGASSSEDTQQLDDTDFTTDLPPATSSSAAAAAVSSTPNRPPAQQIPIDIEEIGSYVSRAPLPSFSSTPPSSMPALSPVTPLGASTAAAAAAGGGSSTERASKLKLRKKTTAPASLYPPLGVAATAAFVPDASISDAPSSAVPVRRTSTDVAPSKAQSDASPRISSAPITPIPSRGGSTVSLSGSSGSSASLISPATPSVLSNPSAPSSTSSLGSVASRAARLELVDASTVELTDDNLADAASATAAKLATASSSPRSVPRIIIAGSSGAAAAAVASSKKRPHFDSPLVPSTATTTTTATAASASTGAANSIFYTSPYKRLRPLATPPAAVATVAAAAPLNASAASTKSTSRDVITIEADDPSLSQSSVDGNLPDNKSAFAIHLPSAPVLPPARPFVYIRELKRRTFTEPVQLQIKASLANTLEFGLHPQRRNELRLVLMLEDGTDWLSVQLPHDLIRSYASIDVDAVSLFGPTVDAAYRAEKFGQLERAMPKLDGIFTIVVPAGCTFDTNGAAAGGGGVPEHQLPTVLSIEQPNTEHVRQFKEYMSSRSSSVSSST